MTEEELLLEELEELEEMKEELLPEEEVEELVE
jgi:hypothetical protein